MVLIDEGLKKRLADERLERNLYYTPAQVADTLHFIEHGVWPAPPRLMRIEISDEMCKGLRIGNNIPSGLGGYELSPNIWLGQGYDGVHLVGYGKTMVGGYTSAIHASHDVGYLLIEGPTLVGGGGAYCVHACIDAVGNPNPRTTTVHLRETDFFPAQGGARSITGGMWYDPTLIAEFCRWRWAGARQHPNYWHGLGPHGFLLRYCDIRGGGEPLKLTRRCGWPYYAPPHDNGTGRNLLDEHPEWFQRPNGKYKHAYEDACHRYEGLPLPGGRGMVGIIEHCYIAGWDQPGSDFGGAGLSVQGPGGNFHLRVSDSIIANPARGSAQAKQAFGVFNGSEYFDEDGIAADEFGRSIYGMGTAQFDRCILQSPVMPASWSPWPAPLVNVRGLLSLAFRNCGLFARGGYVSVRDVRDGLEISGCNTEEILEIALRRGIDCVDIPTGKPFNPVVYGPRGASTITEGYN